MADSGSHADSSRPGPDFERQSGEGQFSKPPRATVPRGHHAGDTESEESSAGAYPFPAYVSRFAGRFFGRGPKGYRRSDERIRDDVSDRLMAHPDVDAAEVEVRVSAGTVILSGVVDDLHQKRIAEHLADDVLGVEDVENRLKVKRGLLAMLTGERASSQDAHAPEREVPRETEREPASSPPRRPTVSRGDVAPSVD